MRLSEQAAEEEDSLEDVVISELGSLVIALRTRSRACVSLEQAAECARRPTVHRRMRRLAAPQQQRSDEYHERDYPEC